tara:strand:- start:1730 stop:2392 length:663 start_codon:yes stop_codon:yes gene_type:complete
MKVNIYLPQSLSEITLKEYKEYDKIILSNKDDANSERFVNLKMLEIFCGVNYEMAKQMPLKQFNTIIQHLNSLLYSTPELVTKFKMGDTEFGFIPSLEDITFGEYIDLDTFLGDVQNLEKAMAVLYRPVTATHKDKYDIQEYDSDLFQEAMLQMPLDAVISSVVFFWNLGLELSNAMMNSLQEENPVLRTVVDLPTNGVGLKAYINLLKVTLEDSEKLQN